MLFTKATGYAIRALTYLASQGVSNPCGLREIAEHEKMPPIFLRKVLGDLRKHRILGSVKGIYGGYVLARPPESITLWEIVQLLEPDPQWGSCLLGRGFHDGFHDGAYCALHQEWQKTCEGFVRMLQTKTIAQLAEGRSPNLVTLSTGNVQSA
jgi:Rrf2 family protein